jgi:hypothetical protein
MPTFSSALEAPLLRDLAADHGPEKVLVALRLALAQTIDMMSVQQPPPPTHGGMSWTQVFALDFMAKYDTESLDDFALFLQMFRRGELAEPGKPQLFGGRVDGPIIFDCWRRYLERKVEAREGMHETRKASAYRDISEAVNKNPSMKKLSEQLQKDQLEKDIIRKREQALKQEQHKLEGLRLVGRANNVPELKLVLDGFPYESVRNAVRNRCKDLGLTFVEEQP